MAQVLHAVAEGLSAQAAARVFQLSETTVRSWITRAGQHSHRLHDRLMHALQLTHVQPDELRLKIRGVAEAAWLWVACDARTKLIPAFALGPRTQDVAYQLVHELAQRLAVGYLPIFSSDGLTLYFYALTAHFGQWIQAVGQRSRCWQVYARLLYGQLIKQYRRRRLAEVRQRVYLGSAEMYRQALRALDFSGRIQTAFVERLNLTIRQSIAGLSRRSWTLRGRIHQTSSPGTSSGGGRITISRGYMLVYACYSATRQRNEQANDIDHGHRPRPLRSPNTVGRFRNCWLVLHCPERGDRPQNREGTTLLTRLRLARHPFTQDGRSLPVGYFELSTVFKHATLQACDPREASWHSC